MVILIKNPQFYLHEANRHDRDQNATAACIDFCCIQVLLGNCVSNTFQHTFQYPYPTTLADYPSSETMHSFQYISVQTL